MIRNHRATFACTCLGALALVMIVIGTTPDASQASAPTADVQPCQDDCNINVLSSLTTGTRTVYCYPDGHWHCTLFPDKDDGEDDF